MKWLTITPYGIGIQIEEPNTRNFSLCIHNKVFIRLSRQYFRNKCISLSSSQTCVFVLLFTLRKKIVEVGTCCLMPYIIFLFMFILCCVVLSTALQYSCGRDLVVFGSSIWIFTRLTVLNYYMTRDFIILLKYFLKSLVENTSSNFSFETNYSQEDSRRLKMVK